MSWADHPTHRGEQLPANWASLRAACRDRAGGRCEYRYPNGGQCHEQGTDADHRTSRDNHEDLQWLCPHHHNLKTQQEARAARAASQARGTRAKPPHPGLY